VATNGFQQTGNAFQATGFAYQQAIASTGAGKKRRKRRYYVEVDGQRFEVASESDAIQILRKASALAERAAEETVKVQAQKPAAKVAPVEVKPPVIRTDAPIDIRPYQLAIEQAYRNAAVAEELRRLLAAQQEEDEIAAYLLLH